MRALSASLIAVCFLFTANGATSAPLPDLDISFTWKQIPNTFKVDFTIHVKNVGSAPAEASGTAFGIIDVLLFSDEANQPTGDEAYKGDMEQALPPEVALGPGASAPAITYTYDYEVAGTYHAWAIVDSISFYPGMQDFALAENSKVNNIFDAVIVLEAETPDLPDLVLQGVNPVVQSDSVSFNVSTKNIGKVDATGNKIFVDVMIDPPGNTCPPTAWSQNPITVFGDAFEDWATGLKVNATHSVTAGPIKLAPGSHTACAAIDIQNLIPESSETNNHFPLVSFDVDLPPEQLKADLKATYISAEVQGDKVIFTGEIKNVGTAQAPPFKAEFYYHALSPPVVGEAANADVTVEGLAPGASTPVIYEWQPAANGSYIPWLCADLQNDSVAESLSDNNCIEGLPYEVALAGDLPDIKISKLSWLPKGADLEYSVTVTNIGSKIAKDVYVDVFFNETDNPDCFTVSPTSPQGFTLIPVIDPGSEATVKVIWSSPPAGTYTSWAKADCLNSISEADETNNDKGPIDVKVQDSSDLLIDLVVVDFSSQVECTNVVYNVTIQNQGDDDAATFQVDIFKDQKSNPGFGSPGDFTFVQEDGLAAGEERVLTIKNWKEAADGNYDSWVVVNTKNEINETDYSNNASGPRNVIIDGQGTLCPNNIELADILGQSCCSCGQKTVSEGFCCFGSWNFEAFDICEDSGTADGGSTGHDDLGNGINADGQGFKGPTYDGGLNLRGDKVGCQHSGQPASPGIAWGIFLMLALVALIRFRSLKQQ